MFSYFCFVNSLYFLAITPDDIISEKITEIKKHVSEIYHSSAALRLPPHITLYPPFKLDDRNENLIINSINDFVKDKNNFSVFLSGFGCFEPRVLFIETETSEDLISVHNDLLEHLRSDINLYDKQNERPFRPHITLASKDLIKVNFYKAWEEYKKKVFSASFTADHIVLFRHDGRRWNICKRFYFLQ